MVALAFLSAIIVVLQLTSGMLPQLPGGANLSLVLIPIVLGSALYGPGAGAFLGAVFGMVALIYSVIGVDKIGAAIFTASPIGCIMICLGKSTVAGFLAGLVYKLVNKYNGYLAMLLASIVCPVCNTALFILPVWLFFNNTYFVDDGVQIVIISLFSAIITLNAIPELVLNILFSPAGQRIIKAVKK